MLEKVLKSAVGSAQDPDQNDASRTVRGLGRGDGQGDGGPMFKRIRPMSRGQAFGILKRTAHITVELERIENL